MSSDRHVLVNDPDGQGAEVINTAPAGDTGQRGVAVRVISQLGAVGGPGGGGTVQYAEDTAAIAGEQLVMFGAVRKDTRASTVDTDGDRSELQVNANGELRVKHEDQLTISNFPASQAVTGPLTDAQLRASAVPVSGTFFQATQPVSLATNTPDVTDRAARLLGHVTVDNASIPVTGPLTDTQLRASAVPVSGPLTDTQLRASAVGVSGPLTDTQLRASAVPVSGPLTDTQLRATAVPVSGTVTANQGGAPWTVKGDQARASATIPNPVVSGFRSAAYPTKPASVTAGQLVDAVSDTEGVLYVRPRQLNTFTALYRAALAAASSGLAFTFTANTDKQLATIFHAAGSTKNVRIRRVWVEIISSSVAGEVQLELRRLTSATTPATGNPAITPINRNPGGAAVDATCLALPTTAGTDFNANAPIASRILNLGATVAQTAPPLVPSTVLLYDESSADDEEEAPLIRAGNAEGYAIVGRSTAATALKFIVRIVFTEE